MNYLIFATNFSRSSYSFKKPLILNFSTFLIKILLLPMLFASGNLFSFNGVEPIIAAPPPSNDDCAGAISLTTQAYATGCVSPLSATTLDATQSNTNCSSSGTNDDVWFTFTATNIKQWLRLENIVATLGTFNYMGFDLYTGSCAVVATNCQLATVQSGSIKGILSGLTIGTTYYLRIWTHGSSNSANFDICLFDPPLPGVNDDCAGAIAITPQTYSNACVSPLSASTLGATQSNTDCNSFSSDDDIWFSFTTSATETNYIVRFDNITPIIGNILGIGYNLYASSCGSAAGFCQVNVNAFSGTAIGSLSGLATNTTYYLRVWTNGTNNYGNFDLCVFENAPAPANDNCANATPFPAIPSDGTCASLLNQTTLGATNSMVTPTNTSGTGCSANNGTPDDDVWFSFVATAATIQLDATWVSGENSLRLQVFSGSCGSSMASILCTSNTSGILLQNLTVNSTYYLRMYTPAGAVITVQSLCLKMPPPPPANDNCAGATPFPIIPTTGNCVFLNSQATTYATASGVTPTNPTPPGTGCTINPTAADDDIWFSFVAPATSLIMQISVNSGFYGINWQVFSGSCGSSMTSIYCNNSGSGSSGTLTGLTIGDTYYIRAYSSDNSERSVISFCLKTTPPIPNDVCANAVTLIVLNNTSGTNVNAIAESGVSNSACDPSGTHLDVWYKFNSGTMVNGDVLINPSNSSKVLKFSVLKGACGSLLENVTNNPLSCSERNFYGLEEDQDYYVRVWSNDVANTDAFSIRVRDFTSTATAPSTGNCVAITKDINAVQDNRNQWVPFTTSTGGVVAAIQANGQDLGTVTVKYNVNANTSTDASGTVIAQRNFSINATTPPIVPVSVRFYLLNTEVATITPSLGNFHHVPNADCATSYNPNVVASPITSFTSAAFGSNLTCYALSTPSFSGFFPAAAPLVLPVELISFKGTVNSNVNAFVWTTASEKNSQFHLLERSEDGIGNWQEIVRKNAAGTTFDAQTYQAIDAKPLQNAYYRIRFVDYDGTEKTSNILNITRKSGFGISNAFPVPTSNLLTVEFQSIEEGNVTLQITDFIGRVAFRQTVAAVKGDNSALIDLQALPTGVYFIKLTSDTQNSEPMRVVKQ
jgi:hypothetical protein